MWDGSAAPEPKSDLNHRLPFLKSETIARCQEGLRAARYAAPAPSVGRAITETLKHRFGKSTMRYVGIDHAVGLSCRACEHTTIMLYSRLLNALLDRVPVVCEGCGRVTDHGWNSVEEARMLVRARMRGNERRQAD